jgi:hypothetical protein
VAYTYLGYATVGFPAYADADTGTMLVPPPGGMWEQPPPVDEPLEVTPPAEPQDGEETTPNGEAA